MVSSSCLAKSLRPGAVYVAFEVFPRAKGASTHMASMVEALARKFAPVLLLCCGDSEMPALQLEGAVTILRHKEREPNLLRRIQGFSLFVFDVLSRLETNPALVVFRDPWGGAPALEALPQCPGLFEVNALPTWELPYRYPALLSNPVLLDKLMDLERFCLLEARRILCVSALTARALQVRGVPSDLISVIPNAAGLEFFSPSRDFCPLEMLQKGRWIGYVGSLHAWQGLEVLLEAFRRVAPDFPEVNLLLVHSDQKAPLRELRRLLRKSKLTERVWLQPPLARGALAHTLSRLEFTCAPLLETLRNTQQGCCPIKIVESMAAGTPVLASNLRVVRDLVTHRVDGYLAESGDPRAFALALSTLLESPELCQTLGRRAKATALSRFTSDHVSDRLLEVFSQAVGKSPSQGSGESICRIDPWDLPRAANGTEEDV